MTFNILEIIRKATGAHEIIHCEDIQSLWSGYGKIIRFDLTGFDLHSVYQKSVDRKSVVVKHVMLPNQSNHPRGWDTDRSHQRKVKSYQVESAWYRNYSHHCDDSCRLPECLALESNEDEFLMVFEDLDASGFAVRKESVSIQEMQVCLRWLANFHAAYLGQLPEGLWQTGTYWHLDTRPDELAALNDAELKRAAMQIDARLQSARYQTLVHGDAKLANFCFSQNSGQVAVVDFQYVGGGCGMKDVAYFIGSCLCEKECERHEVVLLEYYFSALSDAIKTRNSVVDIDAITQEWRDLYPVAWTDFHRFIKGWSPGHWKIHSYSERLAREVLAQLATGPD